MTTDRELLELAAKAAGIEVKLFTAKGIPVVAIPGGGSESCLVEMWNPLTDDGDALRLAADVPDLNIDWIFEKAWQQFPLANGHQLQRREYIRRLVVECAAGHGRSMP